MVMVNSTMMPLGTAAPDFELPDTDGSMVTLSDFSGQPLVVAFICNHCPFVKHLAPRFATLAKRFGEKGVATVAIMSNDIEAYPDDAPAKMKLEKAERDFRFPYLFDASQAVAHAYTAACTPDFFLFDSDHRLYYRGQLDPSRPKRISSGNYDFDTDPATGADLKAAVDALLAGEPAPDKQYPSAGCNIKWKPGNAPDYFGG